MELLVGVERAEAILASLPIENYTLGVTRAHARLAVQAMSQGKQRSAHHLIIAATASATGRTLHATDAKAEFDQLTGVRTQVPSIP